jgi:hypothetical protein
VFLFTVFAISEKITTQSKSPHRAVDEFQLTHRSALSPETVGCRPGNLLVCVGNHHVLWPLAAVLPEVNVERQDIVALHMRVLRRAASGEHELTPDQLFTAMEQTLFTKVVMLAEKEGKQVRLVVVGANSVWDGVVRSAAALQSHTIVLGKSSRMSIREQARRVGLAWERLPPPRPRIALEIYSAAGEKNFFYLGPHAPHLTPRELELLHKLWLELNQRLNGHDLHHNEVVYFALKEVERELGHGDGQDVVQRLQRFLMERDNQPNY